jgi:hypothetical protein
VRAIRERAGEASRAGPDLDDALPAQVAQRDDRVEDAPPALVDRAQLVVARRERLEVV